MGVERIGGELRVAIGVRPAPIFDGLARGGQGFRTVAGESPRRMHKILVPSPSRQPDVGRDG